MMKNIFTDFAGGSTKKKKKKGQSRPVGICPKCKKPVWRTQTFRGGKHWHNYCWKKHSRGPELI